MITTVLPAAIPHLLRPTWMLALLTLPILWWLQSRRTRNDTPWKRAVDPHLLPSLLQAAPASTQHGAWLFGATYALLVLALAGPAWRQQPVALYAPVAPLVVVLDLSSHMLVADLAPTRLLRARLKIDQLITQRKGGQIGLIAYAGDAFTVAPLSDDANSLRDLLAALMPDTMPVDGQRADRAIHRAVDLLAQAGFAHGQILLLSDGADAAAQAAAHAAATKGYTVDALGIGTAAGTPLPSTDGTFAQDAGGAMQVARLDADALRALARAGGGRYAALDANVDDLAALGVLDNRMDAATQRDDADSLRWRDDGPFLLLALLPLVALGFRRGWLVAALLALFVMPVPRAEASETNWWNGLWQRADQRADHALRAGDSASASALAQTPEQRAAAAYRSGNYATAAHGWTTLDSADAHYNRGNALAQMKRYPEAIAAYEHALQLHPDMADAKANLELVRQLQKRQQANRQQQAQQHKDHQPNQHGQDQAQSNQQQDPAQQSQQQQSQQQQGQQRQNQQQPSQQQSQQQQMNQQQQNQDQQRRSVQQQRQQDQQQQAAPDRNKQAQADAAEQRALDQALRGGKPTDRTAQRALVPANETSTQRERREAIEALLQRVPDDPGGLLRRKFALEYARRQQEGDR
jgi:Ca-activated chloride channel family protein